jgi:hypothetical protein
MSETAGQIDANASNDWAILYTKSAMHPTQALYPRNFEAPR